MKFNYNFPYPFLSLNQNYQDLLSTEKTTTDFVFSIGSLQLEEFKHLDTSTFTIGLEVNCSDTLFRRFYEVTPGTKIEIPLSLIRKKVEYDLIAIVNQDIEDFRIEPQGDPFFLEKGSCFASLLNNTAIIDFENTLSGLVKVVRDTQNEYLSYSLGLEYLVIYLPEKDFDNFERIMENPSYVPFLHSALVKPCIMEACYKMSKSPYDFEALWAILLRKFAEDDKSYEEGFPTEEEIPGFVEKFLKNCTSHTIEFLSKGLDDDTEVESGLS